jgi:hypothetical protein
MSTEASSPVRSWVDVPSEKRELLDSPFKIKNNLAGHPLFERERIIRLLKAMPRKGVEIRGVESLGTHDGSYKRGPMLTDADPVATFERMEEKPTWILLHEMWTVDLDYNQLLQEYIGQLAAPLGETPRDLSDLGCWLFLSSGRCVVHFHADPDQSFLNQIRGSKTVYVYPSRVLPETVVEKLVHTGNQGVVVYDPAYEPEMFPPTHLEPGESVFLPLFAPHRVINDPGVSVSWNVGFHTRRSRRRRTLHLVNLELRQRGLRPTGYGRRPAVDAFKGRMDLALRAKNRLFGRTKIEV